ncbi:MAG: hypothetical protein ACAI38_06380 [Myxococcota bacterium]|nr:hypothetical protein [Myxococcota bacterium]
MAGDDDNTPKRRWTKPFRILAQIILAPVVLFEEWGWEPLQRVVGWLVRHSPFKALERVIASLPPYGALFTYATPAIGLLPVKLAALKLIAMGHPMVGIGVIAGAKVVGTAIVARLFHLTKPQLLRIPWFNRLYAWWVPWKTAIVDAVKAFPVVRAIRSLSSELRQSVAGWFRRR